jgi:hypothetical protein
MFDFHYFAYYFCVYGMETIIIYYLPIVKLTKRKYFTSKFMKIHINYHNLNEDVKLGIIIIFIYELLI